MEKLTLAVKISSDIMEYMRRFCAEHGIKQGFFVEKALREQLEKEELAQDLLDFRKNKADENASISFEEYLKLKNA